MVQAAHAEPGHDAAATARRSWPPSWRPMAGWLGLERVRVAPRGDLAPALAAAAAGAAVG